MKPVTVVVKGNRFQAASEAAKRGIPFVFVTEAWDGGNTIGHVPETFLQDVVRWFLDITDGPYPIGTCLWYHAD